MAKLLAGEAGGGGTFNSIVWIPRQKSIEPVKEGAELSIPLYGFVG